MLWRIRDWVYPRRELTVNGVNVKFDNWEAVVPEGCVEYFRHSSEFGVMAPLVETGHAVVKPVVEPEPKGVPEDYIAPVVEEAPVEPKKRGRKPKKG
jgi:hypothetical protein